MYKNVIRYLTYQLKPNSMDSFNFWHGHIYLFLDLELELLSFSCLLLPKISSTSELFLESPFLWFLFLLQFRVQLSELFSTAFNSREIKRRQSSCFFITLLHFGVKYIIKVCYHKTCLISTFHMLCCEAHIIVKHLHVK